MLLISLYKTGFNKPVFSFTKHGLLLPEKIWGFEKVDISMRFLKPACFKKYIV